MSEIRPSVDSLVKRNRRLIDHKDVFLENAWDDFEWSQEMQDQAEARLVQQRDESETLGTNVDEVELAVAIKWDQFYSSHGDKFFKDRKWIFSEFPDLLQFLNPDSEPCSILEVGCGVGNAVTGITEANQNPHLHVFCCDISHNAITILKSREFYFRSIRPITAFQADICKDFESVICKKIQEESIDFITTIFVLSALKPELMQDTVRKLVSLLKPGGMILFRDYARFDLTQLRFKSKSYLGDNYYLRSDGTTSYFFTQQLVHELFTNAGLDRIELKEDNRLLVNRQKSLKMCRCWIQAKYRKPEKEADG